MFLPRSVRSLAPLDEGFEAVVVVGQGLGEGEELGDGLFRAGKAHIDPIAADRDAGRQACQPAGEGVDRDRDADPGAAGLAERGHHPFSACGFVPCRRSRESEAVWTRVVGRCGL